jgi:hypothetical protein
MIRVAQGDAIHMLKKNGCSVVCEGSFISVTGEPGLKLLGAIDFLRKANTVVIVQKQAKTKGDLI